VDCHVLDPAKENRSGQTSNVGMIRAAEAPNVVKTRVVGLKAEDQPHQRFRKQTSKCVIEEKKEESAFNDEVAQVMKNRSRARRPGQGCLHGRNDYEGNSKMPDDGAEACLAAEPGDSRPSHATHECAVSSQRLAWTPNWMTAHGIPTVTLGCGQMEDSHTTTEELTSRVRTRLQHCAGAGTDPSPWHEKSAVRRRLWGR